MDLVVIGSPSGLHATQGIAAARQGLHVLTEKPIEISTATRRHPHRKPQNNPTSISA